ncbi:enoyl-CoA hydratase [Mycobacterium saskatchewanense]|uniref:Enoyl-CoA hydratase n=1 Tax=Mycobacterium saskatchewanense TaxID=220927 RepID=A0A1X2CA11_9MYCO|nr:enoyl-CoA hydratase/isomerase family protein [Mycobacterium saskatchewanense]ORW72673.1 enoyl-CoA hydratase [Mycobacterium saskatchewanense]BBX65972.1 enoyl-CoA hydratase [Mycobacterium saskatchewanense]
MSIDNNGPLRLTEAAPGYVRVTIDNPPLNLLDPEMIKALRTLMDAFEADPNLRVVVFDSADEDYFIAHFDVVRAHEVPNDPGPTGLPAWPDIAYRLRRAPFISITELRGRARGVGSEFVLACDLRFASIERAILCQPEVGCGLVPGGGGIEALTALTGRSRALEVIVGSDDYDAVLAEKYGWINRAIPDADLSSFVDRLARRIASFPPGAQALAKKLVNNRASVSDGSDLADSLAEFYRTIEWPATRSRLADLIAHGLQQRGELENDLGSLLGS